MAREASPAGKRRTRAHVIASQSVNHVERFIIDEGHTAERIANDYGYDLDLFTFDEQGYLESGMIRIQLKASEKLTAAGTDFVYDIDIRDFNLWTAEDMPVILVLFDASKRRAYWLYIQRYFASASSPKPKEGAKTVRVRVPKRQVISRAAIRKFRAFKQTIRDQLQGAIDHG